MAFVLFKDSMKQRLQGLSGLSCSSAASTSVAVASGRAIDRHSPRLRDPHRRLLPSVPKPPLKPKQSNSFSSSGKDSSSSFSSSLKQQQQLYHNGSDKNNNKSTAAARSSTSEKNNQKNQKKKKTLQQVSPASSSRFLLNSSRLLQTDDDDVTLPASLIDDVFLGRGGSTLPVPGHQEALPATVRLAEWYAGEGSSWSSSETGSGVAGASAAARDDCKGVIMRSCSTRTREHQVVVLRVSLHCKGCAGKVKKHISKMEGVTSFDIDIATKKVTVVGDVTPLGVLNSISKVKSAQFWPESSPTPPRASASF